MPRGIDRLHSDEGHLPDRRRDRALVGQHAFRNLDFSNWQHELKAFGRRGKHKISCWQNHDQHTR
jgi:hypothetical protein